MCLSSSLGGRTDRRPLREERKRERGEVLQEGGEGGGTLAGVRGGDDRQKQRRWTGDKGEDAERS